MANNLRHCSLCDHVNHNYQLKDWRTHVLGKSKQEIENIRKKEVKVHVQQNEEKHMSRTDIENKFEQERPRWRKELIKVPPSLLLDFEKNFPAHHTEEDVVGFLTKTSLDMQHDQLMKLKQHQQFVEDVLKNLDKQLIDTGMAAKRITEGIIDSVYIQSHEGDRGTKNRCKVLKKLNESIEQGLRSERSVDGVFRVGKEIIDIGVDTFILSQNKETKGKWGGLSHRVGKRAELAFAKKCHEAFEGKTGLVLTGFKTNAYLGQYLKDMGVNMTISRSNFTEVEHDVMTIIPTEEKVKVDIFQVKSLMRKPWRSKSQSEIETIKTKIRKACGDALKQCNRDITTFYDIFQDLTAEELDNIEINFHVVLPEEEISDSCSNCQTKIITKKHLKDAQSLLQAIGPNFETVKTFKENILQLYKKLASMYTGLSSLVKLKFPGDGHDAEKQKLDEANQKMTALFKEGDQSESNKCIYVNQKTASLGVTQHNIYHSGIGLLGSYVMCGPYGCGKTGILQLELERIVAELNKSQEEAYIYLVVWENKATNLLRYFSTFTDSLQMKENIHFKVLTKEELCIECGVATGSRDTISVVNEVCQKLSKEHKFHKIHVLVDEVIIENPHSHSAQDLIGKVPFLLNGELFPLTSLDPCRTNLILCITPDCEELVEIRRSPSIKMKPPKPGKVPVYVLWRVYRNTNAIHSAIQYLEGECQARHDEFGYLMEPSEECHGHDIEGDLPVWIPAQQKKHMRCQKNSCNNCFLLSIESSLRCVLNTILDDYQIPIEDITIIVSSHKLKKSPESIHKFFTNKFHDLNLQVKINYEFEGMESPVAIVIRDGGGIGPAISSSISRVCNKLFIICPDDEDILEQGCQKKLFTKMEFRKPLCKEINTNSDFCAQITTFVQQDPVMIEHSEIESTKIQRKGLDCQDKTDITDQTLNIDELSLAPTPFDLEIEMLFSTPAPQLTIKATRGHKRSNSNPINTPIPTPLRPRSNSNKTNASRNLFPDETSQSQILDPWSRLSSGFASRTSPIDFHDPNSPRDGRLSYRPISSYARVRSHEGCNFKSSPIKSRHSSVYEDGPSSGFASPTTHLNEIENVLDPKSIARLEIHRKLSRVEEQRMISKSTEEGMSNDKRRQESDKEDLKVSNSVTDEDIFISDEEFSAQVKDYEDHQVNLSVVRKRIQSENEQKCSKLGSY